MIDNRTAPYAALVLALLGSGRFALETKYSLT